MSDDNAFRFLPPGRLVDGDLELILVEKRPADSSRRYVPSYEFAMRSVGQNTNMGHISLRIGNDENLEKYAGHIGYNVTPAYRGHRYAARSCQLILPLARRHEINPIWITCNPDNMASRRTCEIVGARFVETVEVPRKFYHLYKKSDRIKRRYRIDF